MNRYMEMLETEYCEIQLAQLPKDLSFWKEHDQVRVYRGRIHRDSRATAPKKRSPRFARNVARKDAEIDVTQLRGVRSGARLIHGKYFICPRPMLHFKFHVSSALATHLGLHALLD